MGVNKFLVPIKIVPSVIRCYTNLPTIGSDILNENITRDTMIVKKKQIFFTSFVSLKKYRVNPFVFALQYILLYIFVI